jgi:hypothetical protein
MDEWLGASWRTVGFVVVGTVATYLSTLVAIRLAGRRTVAQLSSFDIVVTVAIGSLVASTASSNDDVRPRPESARHPASDRRADAPVAAIRSTAPSMNVAHVDAGIVPP